MVARLTEPWDAGSACYLRILGEISPCLTGPEASRSLQTRNEQVRGSSPLVGFNEKPRKSGGFVVIEGNACLVGSLLPLILALIASNSPRFCPQPALHQSRGSTVRFWKEAARWPQDRTEHILDAGVPQYVKMYV